jgi:membrane protein YdbS with pleckstrin-like domain
VARNVYLPRKSSGQLSLLSLFIVFVATDGFSLYMYLLEPFIFLLVPIIIVFLLCAVFLVLIVGLSSMRYAITDDALEASCSFFLKYKIPLNSIQRIVKRDLAISMCPALGCRKGPLHRTYADVGNVKMCATSASKDILLIETSSGLYG